MSTANEQGISPEKAIRYQHTRYFGKRLTPSVHVAVWWAFMDKEKPWCIAYFISRGGKSYRCEGYKYSTFEELRKEHPFDFGEFELDLRYPMSS